MGIVLVKLAATVAIWTVGGLILDHFATEHRRVRQTAAIVLAATVSLVIIGIWLP